MSTPALNAAVEVSTVTLLPCIKAELARLQPVLITFICSCQASAGNGMT